MSAGVLDATVGVVFCLLGGLLCFSGRRRRIGVLLLAIGTAWLLGSIWPASVFLYRGPLVQLLVCYPRGRPQTRLDTAVVVMGYLGVIQVIGHNNWLTVGLAVIVTSTVIADQRRASGAQRRARLTSSAVCVVLMGVLGSGAAARLAGVVVDPQLVVIYDVMMLTSGVVLFADSVWGRWNRFAITDLVIDLGRTEDSGSVRDKLARALSDPDLEIAFVAPDGSMVDEGGRPVALSDPAAGRVMSALRNDGQVIAQLVHQAGALDDPSLLDSVTAVIGLAVENARLQAGLHGLVRQLESSRRRTLETADAERRDLANELRAGALTQLDRVRFLLGPDDSQLSTMLDHSRSALTDFARGVHPRVLADQGLGKACVELAASATFPVVVDLPSVRLPPSVELTLYFVCAEALANIGKYAGATSARLQLTERAGAVLLTIADDGRGGAQLGGEVPTEGTGLRGLVDRLAVIGGTMTIDSPIGVGTTLTAEVPRQSG